MKTSQKLIYACFLIVAILGTFCSGTTWRPQGRFGKRMGSVETAMPNFGFSQSRDIPVEAFFSLKDLKHAKSKPRLCSVTGLQGFPLCDFSSLLTTGDIDDLALFEI